ncbi:MAG: antitoxin Xre/MbcA/ParS toxin-binding domain-containing protein [Hasllibacter sp.]
MFAGLADHGRKHERIDTDVVLGKAAFRAGRAMGLSQPEIAAVIGVSKATVSNVAAGAALPRTGKSRELAAHLVRVFRSLDAIAGGEEATVKGWVRAENDALGGVPLERMKSVAGLLDVEAYLDQRRAPA